VQCAVCHRPLLEGVASCVVCGAPAVPPQPYGVPNYRPQTPQGYGPPPTPQYAPPPYQQAPQGYGPPPVPQPMYAPQMQQPMVAAYGPRDNTFATVSLVCGLLGLVPLWIGFVLCLVAIGFGVAGIQRAGVLPNQAGKGMAIAGLTLGLIFILPASCGL
jgi:hypothetical protein